MKPLVLALIPIYAGIAFPCTSLAAEQSASKITVEGLRCEYRANPLGVDDPQPRLSWVLRSDQRGQKQTGYQVLVASSPEALSKDHGDLWDSGKLQTDQSIHVPYAGKPLVSGKQCHWKVRAWDSHGRPSLWSQPAVWSMGLMGAKDWQAKWIAAPASKPGAGQHALPLFRREVEIAKPVRRATVHVCGLGHYELSINGSKVGDQVIDPGWTNYRKTCLYATYDVTAILAPGGNALGVILGNGMYNVVGGRYVKFTGSFGPPKLVLQMHVEYQDGTSSVIVTDGAWKAVPGPIVFSCVFGGEDYDARREIRGWDTPGFDDSAWQHAAVVEGPGGRLVSQSAPPVKVMREYKAVKRTEPRPGVFVFDLGQNFANLPRLTVKGPAGTSVRMTPGELLDARGLVSQRSSGGPSYFTYTLKGEGTEIWSPRFTYYGSRYIQVEATPAPGSAQRAEVLDVTGQFIHCSAETVGHFSCSNPTVNRIHELINAAILSNFQSVLTDCPHREKLGWLECSHLLFGCIAYNYDVATFYAKIVRDMREAQLANGLVPDIAPEYTVFSGGFRDSPEWGSAYLVAPGKLYGMYDDRRLLEENYEGMKRYVAYLGSTAKEQIVSHGLGDWYDIGPSGPGESQLTSRGLTATAIYYRDIHLLHQAARLLDKREEAEKYAELARQVRSTFNRKFFASQTNQYDRNSQTANAMPLALGMVEEDRRAAVLGNLVRDVRDRGNRVTAGDVGFHYVVAALWLAGRGDVLYDMVTQDAGPGYVYQLKHGATSLTEAWDTNPASSQNHCMLGHAEEWFYQGLAGISYAECGFKKTVIRPQIVGDLTWVKGDYRSMYGRIVSQWKRDGDRLTLDVTIPANTTATVFFPAKDADSVTESGQPAAGAQGVISLRVQDGVGVFEIGSGSYQFQSQIRSR